MNGRLVGWLVLEWKTDKNKPVMNIINNQDQVLFPLLISPSGHSITLKEIIKMRTSDWFILLWREKNTEIERRKGK